MFFQSEVPCLEFTSQVQDLHKGVEGNCFFYAKGRSRALLRATTWEQVWQELRPRKEQVKEQVEHPGIAVTDTPQDGPSGKKDAALIPDVPSPATEAQASWHKELAARISSYKRYPEAAKAKQLQGSAKVKLTIDRAGRVLVAQIVQTSGSALLDAEAINMVLRAGPLPAPPPETPGTSFDVLLPVRFEIDHAVQETHGVNEIVAQAERLISSGDVQGAREILTKSDTAIGAIAFALAETYDPNTLAAWGAKGVQPDVARAKTLYRQAMEHGQLAKAIDRLVALPGAPPSMGSLRDAVPVIPLAD